MSTDPIRTTALVLGGLRQLVREHRGGMSYAAAAAEIGVGKATLMSFEKGDVDPGLGICLKLVNWVTPPAPLPLSQGRHAFTPAARRLLDALHARHGLGQAWLRIEPGLYGLVAPDVEGTLGELAYVGSFTYATLRECEPYLRRRVVAHMPPYRGPRNRAYNDHGYPLELRPQADAHVDNNPEEGDDDTDGLQDDDEQDG